MKKITIILALTIITTFSLTAQTTYVPDDNFEQALIDLGYDTGGLDDYVLTANIENLTTLDVSNKNIADLTGIEDFTALTSLDCYSNQLTALDISANTALTSLKCHTNQLTSLDVNSNTALTYLSCYTNQLTSLDVNHNTALTRLFCYNNQISSIDISQNILLTNLNVSNNLLTAFDVSMNTSLKYFYFKDNQISNIDVSSNTLLIQLWCNSNQLTNIDVSSNTLLTQLRCNNNQIINLDVSINTLLTDFRCDFNQLTNLDVRNGNNPNFTYLNASNNPNLTCIFVDDAAYSTTNWTYIDAASTFVETEAECDALTATTYMPDDNFEQALIDLGYDTGALDDYVLTANIENLTTLDVSNKNIADLTGIEDFTSLSNLDCHYNQLTSLDVSANMNLTALICSYNNLTILDVRNGNNTNFTTFSAEVNNDLTCIFVDDAAYSTTNWIDIDAASTFVETQAECDALGIDELIKSAFTIYPNPTEDSFSIQTNLDISFIEIYDVSGKLLKTVPTSKTITISELQAGVYFVKVITDNGSGIHKIIKK